MDPTPYAESLIEPLSNILGTIERDILRQDPFDPLTTERAFTVGIDTHLSNTFMPPLITSVRRGAPNAVFHSRLLPAEFMHRYENDESFWSFRLMGERF